MGDEHRRRLGLGGTILAHSWPIFPDGILAFLANVLHVRWRVPLGGMHTGVAGALRSTRVPSFVHGLLWRWIWSQCGGQERRDCFADSLQTSPPLPRTPTRRVSRESLVLDNEGRVS
jgi:hypothetical protein